MDITIANLNRLWAESTDTITSWASSLTISELRAALDYLGLRLDGNDIDLRWRLLRYHQQSRHLLETINSEREINPLSVSERFQDTSNAVTSTGFTIPNETFTIGKNVGGLTFANPLENFTTFPVRVQNEQSSVPVSRSTMIPAYFQGLTQTTGTRPTTSEHLSTSFGLGQRAGTESNDLISLIDRDIDLDASYVTAHSPSVNQNFEPFVQNNYSFATNRGVPSNVRTQATPHVSTPLARTEFPSQFNFGPRLNVHQIVQKWNLSFDGKRDNSAEEFLTRIEECRRGSSLTDDDLFRAMPFLLKSPAHYWFRFNKNKWNSWEEFLVAFRRRYGGMNFQLRIRDEGRRRTQGPDEPIADYLLNLQLILEKYDPPMSEHQQLQLAINNLHPIYRAALPKVNYKSFAELEEAGERYEASKEIDKSYLPPPPAYAASKY